MVLVDIDKQYKFPTQLNEITLKQFININTLIKKGEFDEALMDLLNIDSEVYFNIDNQGRINLIELLTILMNGEIIFEQILICMIWKVAQLVNSRIGKQLLFNLQTKMKNFQYHFFVY